MYRGGLAWPLYPVAMAAYVATGHIRHARPHRPGPDRIVDASVTLIDPRASAADPEDLTSMLFAGLEPDRRPDLGATWSETTFFLFDPESWR